MNPIRILHFSDVLCVWAYVSQIRIDELLQRFSGQVELESRFFQVFGNVHNKMDTQWSKRGGIEGYAKHVKEVAAQFEHASLHPEVWVRNTPHSSMPSHLFLCAVRVLETRGDADQGVVQRAAWTIREVFFKEATDVSQRSTLLELAERTDLPVSRIEAVLESGEAHAALSEDLEIARDQTVRASPTLIFNEGRQRLTGNVGYRIIEANVSELMEQPPDQQSWC